MTLTSVQPAADVDIVSATPLRVALLGCGTVGSEVARLLTEQAADLRARVGRSSSWGLQFVARTAFAPG